MSLHDRAAQFSPFAALTGHEAAIKETARLTDDKQILSEDVIEKINGQLKIIAENNGVIPDIPHINNNNFITKETKELFGDSVKVEYKYVNEIPTLRGGKTRMTVCNIPDKIQ